MGRIVKSLAILGICSIVTILLLHLIASGNGELGVAYRHDLDEAWNHPFSKGPGFLFTLVEAWIVVVIVGSIYLVPSWVCALKNSPKFAAIFAGNLLLGWTFLGWVLALVWALAPEKTSSPS